MLTKADLNIIKKDSGPTFEKKRDLKYSRWHAENLTIEYKIGSTPYSNVFNVSNRVKDECVMKIIQDLEQKEALEYKKKMTMAASFCGSKSREFSVCEIIHFEEKLVLKGNSKLYQIVIMLEKGLCSLEDVHIDKVKKKTPWIEEHLVKLMYCICVPLDRCKEYKLWHCNLHERNIIISKDGTTFLVTDFGCPRLLKKRPPSRPYQSDYLAPECIGQIHDLKFNFDPYKADVYSMGILFLKLISLKREFRIEDRKEIPTILKDYRKEYPFITKLLGEMILIEDPIQRSPFKDIKYHIMMTHNSIDKFSVNGEVLVPEKRNQDSFEYLQERQAIARAYEYISNFHMAEKTYLEVLDLWDKEDAFSKESVEGFAMCLENVAVIQIRRKNFGNALHSLNRLENFLLQERVKYALGETHMLYTCIYQYYGVIYFQLDDLDKAFQNMEKSYLIGKDTFGEKHVNTAICQQHLGIIKFFRNEIPEAVDKMMEIQGLFQDLTGQANEDSLISLAKIAHMYTRLEKYDIALELYTKVRNICKEHHGEDAESYIDAVIDVAKIYKRLKEYKTAFQLQLAMLEKIRMNKNKDKFAEALSELADTFSKQEKHNEAIYTAELAFNVYSRIYFLKHPSTIKAYQSLLKITADANDEETNSKYRRLLPVMKENKEIKNVKVLK